MEPTLKIAIKKGNKKYQVVKFSGEFDKAGYSDIREQLDEFLDEFKESSSTDLVFDFSDMKYINSQGIGVLMEIHGKLKEVGKGLIVVGMNDNVTDVFKAIGMMEIVKTYKNITEYSG